MVFSEAFWKRVWKCHGGSLQLVEDSEQLDVLETSSSFQWNRICTQVHRLLAWRTMERRRKEHRSAGISKMHMAEPLIKVLIEVLLLQKVQWSTESCAVRRHSELLESIAAIFFPTYVIFCQWILFWTRRSPFHLKSKRKMWLQDCRIETALLRYLTKRPVHNMFLQQFHLGSVIDWYAL